MINKINGIVVESRLDIKKVILNNEVRGVRCWDNDFGFDVKMYNDRIRIIDIKRDCFTQLELAILNEFNGLGLEDLD